MLSADYFTIILHYIHIFDNFVRKTLIKYFKIDLGRVNGFFIEQNNVNW